MCKLNVSKLKLEIFSKPSSTFLVKRFDREGKRRIHFASAMTLLGKSDGASAADGTSYLDIVSFINSNGAKDIAEKIVGIVRSNWERLAKECGIPRGKIEDMRPAFSECYR